MDDGSQDNTPNILQTFGGSILFAGLDENHGAGAARNYGASLATGEYLVFLDGNDVLMPWALDIYHRLIAACHPQIILGRSTKCVGKVPAREHGDSPMHTRFVVYPDFLARTGHGSITQALLSFIEKHSSPQAAGQQTFSIRTYRICSISLLPPGRPFLRWNRQPFGTECIRQTRFAASRPLSRGFMCCWLKREPANIPVVGTARQAETHGLAASYFTGPAKPYAPASTVKLTHCWPATDGGLPWRSFAEVWRGPRVGE